jgi:hypothetical protein
MAPADRLRAYAVSALMLGAVLQPLWRDPENDGFPLSTYPMFARDRQRLASIDVALALGPGGAETAIPPPLVGSQETMQAVRILGKSVRAGPVEARKLCHAIAARVAHSQRPELREANQIALVRQTVDVIDYARGDHAADQREEVVRCPVLRSAR